MVTVLAPMAGWVSPLGEVPDPVFADKLLGDGVAVDPIGADVVAPCDGVIIALASHAFTIRGPDGVEILTHVGLDTVELKGEGFSSRVQQGQTVKAGEVVLVADLDFLARNAKSLISPVIIANSESFRIARRSEHCEVKAGDFLLEVAPIAAAATLATQAAAVTGTATVAGEHGLHARPAAFVANTAKRFSGAVTLSCRGRSADAKSATAIMALGAHQGDAVTIAAPSRAAVDAIVAAIGAAGARELRVLAPAAPVHQRPSNTVTKIYAVPAAPGRAIGPAMRLRNAAIVVREQGDGIATETRSLREALVTLRTRLEVAAASGDRAHREILSAHVALLDDPGLIDTAERMIAEGKSAAYAWRTSVQASAEVLRAMDDVRMRERAGDLLDLERQLLALLADEVPVPSLPNGAILIAEEILPSDLTSGIAGFVSAGGGPTSHAAILAAGMNIPALVGAGSQVLSVPEGTELLLDADEGVLDLEPDPLLLAETKRQASAAVARQLRDQVEASADCFTADGIRIEVFANLGKGAEEAAAAVRLGAEGCGVLRTEFLFMDRDSPPGEDEQLAAYQGIAEALAGRSFIIRTFDIGADKPVPYLQFPPEDNPQLGLRGVRTAAVWPELLKTQLSAAARVKDRVKIMLPMITGPHELRTIRSLLDDICRDLNVPVPELGAMIETPSSALLADRVVAEADFLSIGTNDLTQYALAIDRGHRTLSAQLDGLHPAVLRLVARTADAATAVHKPAAVCGSLAADPLAAPLLIGLGITELSVPPPVIPRLKAAIRCLSSQACRSAATAALALESPAAVRALVKANFTAVEEDLS